MSESQRIRCDRQRRGTRVTRLAVFLLLLGTWGFTSPEVATCSESDASPESPVRALLIGVSRYPSLSRQRQLRGPVHDVQLLHDLLRQQFSVPDNRIRVLSEESGELPTRGRIALAFDELIENVQPGETVLILFSGHGSQQPADDAAETDQLDEIFLPRDIGRWNGRAGTVTNAIVDNEIREWTKQLRERGAFVFLVADTCHAGTLARGHGLRARRVASDELSIPANDNVRKDGSGNASRSRASPGAPLMRYGEGLLALYASQSHELTYEQRLPGRNGNDHGRLTWTLCQLLAETNGAVSYRELARLIHWHYQAKRWTLSTPNMEGAEPDLNRLVLQSGAARNSLVITPRRNSRGEFEINGGTLRGLTPGAVLAVYLSGQKQHSAVPVGYVRVRNSDAVSSTAVPVTDDDWPVLPSLDGPARCEVVDDGLELEPHSVAVDVTATTLPGLAPTLRQRLENVVATEASGQLKLFELAQPDTPADWILETDQTGKSVYLVPGTADQADLRFGSWNVDQAIGDNVTTALNRAVRASRLRQLATQPGTDQAGTGLQVTVERREDVGFRAVTGSVVRPGDELRLLLRNTGRHSVDATVLYVQSNYDIEPFFPLENELLAFGNRIDPGGEVVIDQIDITGETTGWEDLIVIAVNATGPVPQDFSFLAQPGLTPARTHAQKHASRAAGVRDVFDSPLGRRCRRGLFGDLSATRGTSAEPRDYVVRRISWTVAPVEARD